MKSTVHLEVQSALLEAMAERQVSVGGTTYPLPLFLVMATQNPIEQEGTYPSRGTARSFSDARQGDYPNSAAERDISNWLDAKPPPESNWTNPKFPRLSFSPRVKRC